MKKLLFICDGDHFSKGAMKFIASLNEKEHITVKAVFFTPVDFQQLIPISYIPIAEPYVRLKESEQKLVAKGKKHFVDYCVANHISYEVSSDADDWNAKLLETESRFADLLVISEELLFSDAIEEQPNIFMKEMLRATECPVVIISEKFESPERVIIAYDGKQESMHALKQFCYVLPELTGLPTEIVFIKNEVEQTIPEEKLLRDYAKVHFESMNIEKLHFNAATHFASWASSKGNSLIVSGSFGRSALSEFLKGSFVKKIIHEHKLPVFIAHQ